MSEIIKQLLELDVNEHKEGKNGLAYLSWVWAWREVLKICPSATYKILRDESGLPMFGNDKIGYMVFTEVILNNETKMMWLPVMGAGNNPMKGEPYEVTTRNKKFTVDAIDMFAINTSLMRCLTKNLAMFGLGLYIYAGEDLPELQPTNIDCNELITVGHEKGYKPADIERSLIKAYRHGMEFITQSEHDEALAKLKALEVK